MSKSSSPSFDFCQFQRFINNVGGDGVYKAYSDKNSYYPRDRTAQYGFKEWSDLAPWVPKGKRDWLQRHPARSGVYAIRVSHVSWDDDGRKWRYGAAHLLYIGSSANIKNRLSNVNHWLTKCEAKFNKPDHVVSVVVLLAEDYLPIEKSLIQNLRPLLNVCHTGRKRK